MAGMKIETTPIDKLVPYVNNARTHSPEQVDQIAASIKEFGFNNPVLIDKKNVIIAGHGRVMAARKLELKEVPTVRLEHLTETQKKAFILADNKIAMNAGWDEELLALELKDLDDVMFDLNLTGFDGKELDELIQPEPVAGLTDEDEVPEAPVEPVTKTGDLWILGNHRLLCGDSTKPEDVERLMDGRKADMVFTDPPYGMRLDADYSKMPVSPSGAKPIKHRNIKGDHDDFSEELIQTIFTSFDYCEDIFICGADYFCEIFPNKNSGSWIVWDKRVTENFDRMIGSAFELIWSKKKRKREIARINNTLYSGEADAKCKVHPTQKPLKLYDWIFERVSGHKFVADLFLGSGSTLIACEKTNRKCYGMELDEHYCDVIIKRWQDFTGKEAVNEAGQKYNDLKNESKTAQIA